ncbi:DUF3592 domain-containing protein [Pontiellaceae bacterium B12219]|nr:DUF3592 domain-containing protein [Pontiellaceae bacterium B12219]
MRTRVSGITGKLIFSAFGLFFAVFGLLFVKQEWKSLQATNAMQQWAPMVCTIKTCTVEDAGNDYRLSLSYRYTVNGQTYTADQYGKQRYLIRKSFGEIKDAEKKLLPGKNIDGFHNPADPAQAVLDLPTPGSAKTSFGLTLLFPAFGILFAALPWLRGKGNTNDKVKKERSPKTALILFGTVFVFAGGLMLKPMVIEPLRKIKNARTWESVPAVVVSSKVKSHSSDDGTTYSPYIAYRYEIDGQEFFGDQLTFTGGSSSGYESKAALIRQYPKGHAFHIYANPDNPAESVINPEASAALFLGLIPLLFMLAGCAVIISGFRAAKESTAQLNPDQAQQAVVQLKSPSPVKKSVGLTLFACLWNGIVVILFKSDAPALFWIIFGFFGILISAGAVQALLSIFNPRPSIDVTPGNIRPGTNVALRWRINGKVERISQLTITLQCLKITTETSGYGKNRSTRIVRKPLFEESLFSSSSPVQIPQGALEFNVPEGYAVSRPGNDNGIQWQLRFHGDIPNWPDINDEFSFLVYLA